MSFLWIIIVQWAVVMNVVTGQVFTIVVVQWVCLSKFHEWWEFEVPRYREMLCRQSPLELAKPKAPPPGSRVAVHFTDGRDYEAIVTEVNDTRATVQFNNGETMPLTFPDPDVRVTHVEPAPSTGSSTGSFVVADDVVEDEGGPDAEVEPVPNVRRSRAPVSSYVDDENNVAPPEGSRVVVSYDNGKDYEGTVVEVLDASHAWVLFDNYESDHRVDFSDGNFEVTHRAPEPVPERHGVKRKRVDEDYDPTAENVEEDEDDEQDEQKYDSDGDVQM